MIVNIYCTKGDYIGYVSKKYVGKVVARFTLNDVYAVYNEILVKQTGTKCYIAGRSIGTRGIYAKAILECSCLSYGELDAYLKGRIGYAWEIDNLEIFNEPKELDRFDYPNPSGIVNVSQRSIKGLPNKKHPPQSWCYVEELL